jgi:hypothetical protein
MFHIVEAETDDLSGPKKRKKGKILKAMPAFLTVPLPVVKLSEVSDIESFLSENRAKIR